MIVSKDHKKLLRKIQRIAKLTAFSLDGYLYPMTRLKRTRKDILKTIKR